MSQSHRWLGCLLLVSLPLAGCGSNAPPGAKPTKPVKVTVTYKGAPVSDADVSFIYQGPDQIYAFGKTDAQGVARLKTYVEGDGAVLGTHKVTIIKVETVGEKPAADQDSPDYAPPTGNEPPTKLMHHIPTKYDNPGSSGLTAEVTSSGPNDFKFDLTD
jgi:hypothetical protein